MLSLTTRNILILPDTLTNWPWKRTINPLYEEVKKESSAWVKSLKMSSHAQKAIDLCDPSEYVPLSTYILRADLMFCQIFWRPLCIRRKAKVLNPLAPLSLRLELITFCNMLDILRVGCDLMNFIFLCDEYTDFATEEDVQYVATVIMDAMRNPGVPRPPSESIIGEAAKQFYVTLLKCTSETVGQRFIESYEQYLGSVIMEAKNRTKGHTGSVNDYLIARRNNIAVKPIYVILHSQLGLPNEFFNDPVVQRLTQASIDMILICNDIYSYIVEQSCGNDGNNLVTIVMNQENLAVKEAMEWISDYFAERKQYFLSDIHCVPSFGDSHSDSVRRYIDSLGISVIANDCWCFETQRYFGVSGLEIQRTRKVALLDR
ncbi:hypothetical protein H0H87_008877 [Tephrocybe sp. NHM501043]|nr:hypothetical protein H0H87_008877 [Tephrocybe sp. NHM501043]